MLGTIFGNKKGNFLQHKEETKLLVLKRNYRLFSDLIKSDLQLMFIEQVYLFIRKLLTLTFFLHRSKHYQQPLELHRYNLRDLVIF